MVGTLLLTAIGQAMSRDGSAHPSTEAATVEAENDSRPSENPGVTPIPAGPGPEPRPEYPREGVHDAAQPPLVGRVPLELLQGPERLPPGGEQASDTLSKLRCRGARGRRKFRVAGKRLGRRLYAAFEDALCGGDACYQSRWRLLESASFWIDSARPQSRTRVRWDYGSELILPDRAEYFWARVGGLGPPPQAGSQTVNQLNYHELSLYTETAHEKFSAFVVTPYRSLYLNEAGHDAGFADIQIGTKSLLHDSPLLQVTLQMTTTIPSANSREGLGTGHVALEPALLFGLALTDRDFLQAQAAEWIPLGGDERYAGALLRWGVAWNRIVWQRDRNNLMTANLDLAGWSFQDGAYTDPNLGPRPANDETYFYLGPGTRWLFCGTFEFGIGGLFALSDRHFAEQLLRTDLTVRY